MEQWWWRTVANKFSSRFHDFTGRDSAAVATTFVALIFAAPATTIAIR